MKPAKPLQPSRKFLLTIACQADHVVITLSFEAVPPIDRERRLLAVRKAVDTAIQKAAGVVERAERTWLRLRFPPMPDSDICLVRRKLIRRIQSILDAPLDPRTVDRALGIEPRERLRWYKDGRLPICGKASIGEGNHRANVPLFPIDGIAQILANRHVIEAWRNADKEMSEGRAQPMSGESAMSGPQ